MLFDGVCNLCNYWVQFVIKHNAQKTIKMAALQSDVGKKQVQHLAIPEGYLDSLVVIKNNIVYTHSDAVLELIQELGGAWKILTIGKLLPKKWRDSIYKWVAKNRYKWFGRQENCMVPSPELNAWFL